MEVKQVAEAGVQIGIVIGAGNLFRGDSLRLAAQTAGMQRVTADHIGMLGTVINALAFRDALEHTGTPTWLANPGGISGVSASYSHRDCMVQLRAGNVALLAGGTGNPLFTTDTAACLRGIEIGADAVLKATKVDGVYDADPARFEDARRFESLTFDDAIVRDLKVMDLTAMALCRDHAMRVVVYDMNQADALTKIVQGDKVGTVIGVQGEGGET